MSDENVVNNSASLVDSSSFEVDDDSTSSSLWTWALLFVAIGIFMLVVYYYILHFYDATSIGDAIENAIKRFNSDTSDEEDNGNTGDTGDNYYSDKEDEDEDEDLTFKKVLLKALDNATTEGFSSYDADTSVGTIQKRGSLNWGFIDNNNNCSVSESEQCMSGDIFPTRDIHINPKLRTQ